MAVETEKLITCDVCGTPKKGASNDWYRIRGGFRMLEKNENRRKGDLDVCGDRCAHSQLDTYLSQKREAARAEAEAIALEIAEAEARAAADAAAAAAEAEAAVETIDARAAAARAAIVEGAPSSDEEVEKLRVDAPLSEAFVDEMGARLIGDKR